MISMYMAVLVLRQISYVSPTGHHLFAQPVYTRSKQRTNFILLYRPPKTSASRCSRWKQESTNHGWLCKSSSASERDEPSFEQANEPSTRRSPRRSSARSTSESSSTSGVVSRQRTQATGGSSTTSANWTKMPARTSSSPLHSTNALSASGVDWPSLTFQLTPQLTAHHRRNHSSLQAKSAQACASSTLEFISINI